MGQQQLLLIVLGVIIVGVAVVVGINLFNANAETSTQDSIVSQGTNLGAMAQQYYKKPVAMGGGGNTWTNGPNGTDFQDYFDGLPLNLRESNDADWTVTTLSDSQIVLNGDATKAGYTTWHVETTITPTTIASEVK